MEKTGNLKAKWHSFMEKPAVIKTKKILDKTGHVLSVTGQWIYKLRSIILAVPVALAAVVLALYNQQNLPKMVGINLQANGEYAQMIGRSAAVMGPLAVTALCLLLMFCSRRVIYPWIISIFSLVLPILIYVTNIFPG